MATALSLASYVGAWAAGVVVSGAGVASAAFAFVALALLCNVFQMVWLHRVWRALDPADLADGSRGLVTPGAAVGRHFVPFYNVYWRFEVRRILCNALEAEGRRAGVPAEPPRVAGEVAGLAEIVPLVNLVLGSLLCVAFMSRVDAVLARVRGDETP